jgi:hypothetical protein
VVEVEELSAVNSQAADPVGELVRSSVMLLA